MKMISFAKLSHRHLSGVTFEIKTTMKDKFGPNATPLSGKLTEIQVDYKKNIRRHTELAERALYFMVIMITL
ncbi:hypothetical protein [Providencia stuartii]|uniref:hypothetical protein n=1 Tax=Providencia stuartii TaxID=588 RepID=UPI000589F603|nr:hypothetical protein [Providencia stuartii]